MIHLNKSEEPHECLTDEEVKQRYPIMWEKINAPRPFEGEGKRFRDMRGKKDITLREMAKKINVPVGELSDMEQGRKQFTTEIKGEYYDLCY